MAQKLNVNMPEDVVIGDGWTVEWDAVDPTTGASVSGVVISQANVTAADESLGLGTGTAGPVGPYMLVPGPGA
jgi:hypothetical protein